MSDVGLLDFTTQTYPRYTAAPHHRLLAAALERVERGELKRLMVFMPPRHGKSELASVRFPAWYLGRNPDRRIIAAAYGGNLANKFSRRTRNLIASPVYQRIFPGTEVAGDAAAVQFWAIKDRDGQYNAAGVGGGITGEGANLLLIDDPVKDAQDAMSLTVREGTWEWYVSTAYPRLDDANGAIVLIQTRWHEDDLAGKLLAEAADGGDQWHVIRLPAIAEDNDPLGRVRGEALWPVRFPAERLAEIERIEKPRGWWEALYQQTPPEALGGRYFRMWAPTKDGRPYHVWTEEFARAHYGIKDADPFPPVAWTKWGSVDGGYRDPWCAHFWARTPDRKRVFLYRELYEAQVPIPEQAKRIRRFCRTIDGYRVGTEGEDIDHFRVDPSMYTPRANVGVADAHVYAQNGVPTRKGFNSRVMGWRRLIEALCETDDGYPGLVVLDGKAPHLVRTLPRLTADPDDPEDVEDGQDDHAPDCARYGINPAAAPTYTRQGRPIDTRMPGTNPANFDPASLGQTGIPSEF